MHRSLSCPETDIPVVESPNSVHIKFTLKDYLQRSDPLPWKAATRTVHPQGETTADERRHLRRLAGTRVMFCGSASLSIQAATVGKSMDKHLNEANRTLCSLKANADVGLSDVCIGETHEHLNWSTFRCFLGTAPETDPHRAGTCSLSWQKEVWTQLTRWNHQSCSLSECRCHKCRSRTNPWKKSATIDEASSAFSVQQKKTVQLDQEDDLTAKPLKTKVYISTGRRTRLYGPQ